MSRTGYEEPSTFLSPCLPFPCSAGGPQYVTEQIGLRLAGEVSRRGRASVIWRLVREPKPSDIELVHGAIVKNPLKQVRHGPTAQRRCNRQACTIALPA